jgi:hypothetical protein
MQLTIASCAPSLLFGKGKRNKGKQVAQNPPASPVAGSSTSSNTATVPQVQQNTGDQVDFADAVLDGSRAQYLRMLLTRIEKKQSEGEKVQSKFVKRIGSKNAGNPEFIKNLKGKDKAEYEKLLKIAAEVKALKEESEAKAASYGMTLHPTEEDARQYYSGPGS